MLKIIFKKKYLFTFKFEVSMDMDTCGYKKKIHICFPNKHPRIISGQSARVLFNSLYLCPILLNVIPRTMIHVHPFSNILPHNTCLRGIFIVNFISSMLLVF